MSGFDLHLTDKVFLVAGASEGLGFATAKTLAEMGANVSICARRQDILSNAAQRIRVATGREVFPYGGDLTDPEFPGCWVDAVVGRWKRIDGVFTNNGGPPSGTFESFWDDAWEDAMSLTLMPAVRLVREALPYLKRKNGVVLHSVSMSVRQPHFRAAAVQCHATSGGRYGQNPGRRIRTDGHTGQLHCSGVVLYRTTRSGFAQASCGSENSARRA